MSEGCERVSYTNKTCQTCRRHLTKDKACATEGCERKPGNSKHCPSCRLPARAKRCGHCGMQAWHNHGSTCCYICKTWRDLGKGRGIKNSFTEFEYLCLLHEADKCPDTGHIFDDCSSDKMMRKSPDRIDTTKGYEPGNVRVTTWLANCRRHSTELDKWLPMAAEKCSKTRDSP
jgi:hypothetical protein